MPMVQPRYSVATVVTARATPGPMADATGAEATVAEAAVTDRVQS
jgi:hypothetical protein